MGRVPLSMGGDGLRGDDRARAHPAGSDQRAVCIPTPLRPPWSLATGYRLRSRREE